MSTFVVRPSGSEKEKDAFRVRLTAASLLGLKLKPGDLCNFYFQTDDSNSDDIRHAAIAWEASGGGMKDNIVQTSKLLQDLYGFKLGDKVTIERPGEALEDAGLVKIASEDDVLATKEAHFWEYYAQLAVRSSHEHLANGQRLSLKAFSETRQFKIVDVGASGNLARVADQTRFQITADPTGAAARTNVVFASDKIGGLNAEIKRLQGLVDSLLNPDKNHAIPPIQGVLIYGAKGVGKSHFIDQLAKSGWKNVIRWKSGVKIPIPRQPTLIIVDNRYIPSSKADATRTLTELEDLFTTVQDTPCMVIGETSHPNDIHPELRSDYKFAIEIEIPIPSAAQRKDTLFAIWAKKAIPRYPVIEQLAERTHGYVGMDLRALLRRVIDLALERERQKLTNGITTSMTTTTTTTNSTETSGADSGPSYTILPTDIDSALTQIRPSALQEIFLETPSTLFTDIGGQHTTKRQLTAAISNPLKHSARMSSLGLTPKKGILLYGPPGCSKTLLVRALAREAGLNFLAVKGAEMLSMYVGESERAVREIFRKAKAASPAIIFFDEIDSIAARGRPGSELNVLTTLLNEMDGFEDLRDVFVVAATNKPDVIDPALLRPGRFDEVVYVGLPDYEARREIFEIQFKKSTYLPGAATLREEAEEFAAATDGFSGAEVVAIRSRGAEFALEEGRDWYGRDDVERALSCARKGVTREMLAAYEAWNEACKV